MWLYCQKSVLESVIRIHIYKWPIHGLKDSKNAFDMPKMKMIEQILWYAIIIWLLARNNAIYSAVVTELVKELVSPFSPSNWFTRVEDFIIRSYQDKFTYFMPFCGYFSKRSYIWTVCILIEYVSDCRYWNLKRQMSWFEWNWLMIDYDS